MSLLSRAVVAALCLAPVTPASSANAAPHKHAVGADTKSERLLALTIWAEARSRGPAGMRSIGHVVVNRARSGDYGKGIAGVVWQPGQFGCWRGRDPNRKAMRALGALPKDGADYKSWLQAKDIAHVLIRGAGRDPTRGATHYAQARLSPSWAKGIRHTATLAGYKFYRETPPAAGRSTPG